MVPMRIVPATLSMRSLRYGPPLLLQGCGAVFRTPLLPDNETATVRLRMGREMPET